MILKSQIRLFHTLILSTLLFIFFTSSVLIGQPGRMISTIPSILKVGGSSVARGGDSLFFLNHPTNLSTLLRDTSTINSYPVLQNLKIQTIKGIQNRKYDLSKNFLKSIPSNNNFKPVIVIENEESNLELVSIHDAILIQMDILNSYIKNNNLIKSMQILKYSQELMVYASLIVEKNQSETISRYNIYKNNIDGIKISTESRINSFEIKLNAFEKEILLYRWLIIGLFGLLGVDTIIKRIRKGKEKPDKLTN